MDIGDTMSVFPIFMGFWITFSTIGGIVFYPPPPHYGEHDLHLRRPCFHDQLAVLC
jgi:hypothetical protein